MRAGVGLCFVVLSLVVPLVAPRSAEAQAVDDATRGAARQLGYSGVEAYQAGDYPTASQRLEKAFLVLRVPSLGLWSARALVKIGKLVEARERYVDIQSLSISGGDATVQEQAKRDAKSELDAVSPRVPSLVVELEGAQPNEVTVFVDGTPINSALVGEKRPINPGKHSVGARRGAEQANADIDVTEGEVERAVLRFGTPQGAPTAAAAGTAAPAESQTQHSEASSSGGGTALVGWVAVGVGSAALVVGAVTGAMVLSKKSNLESNQACQGEQCLESARNDVESYNSLRTISGVSLIAGAVIAGAGVVLLATAPSAEHPSAALAVGPASVVLRGRF
jgi:hypothetical protein